MVIKDLDFKNLIAVRTSLRSEFTVLFVLSKNILHSSVIAVLALDRRVLSCVVLDLLFFRNDHSAFKALEIHALALHLVHPQLGHFDHALAVIAHFLLSNFNHASNLLTI